MPKQTINGCDYYYELQGQGQPLVLICGYTSEGSGWMPILNQLTAHFKVLIFDNRAVGQTKDDGSAFTIETMADDSVALAKALKLENPHFVGSSMGGCIVQSIAARYPDYVAKLGLLVTSAKWRLALLQGLHSILKVRESGADQDTLLDLSMPWMFGQAFLSDSAAVDRVIHSIKHNPHGQSVVDQARQFRALELFDGIDQLSTIKAPTLVVHAKEDVASIKQDSDRLMANIANATLVELDCGHCVAIEQSNALAQALIEFLL